MPLKRSILTSSLLVDSFIPNQVYILVNILSWLYKTKQAQKYKNYYLYPITAKKRSNEAPHLPTLILMTKKNATMTTYLFSIITWNRH